jgi:hypothetical protein
MTRSPNKKRQCPTCRRRRPLVMTRGGWPEPITRNETYVFLCRSCLPRMRTSVMALRESEPKLASTTVETHLATRRQCGFGARRRAA